MKCGDHEFYSVVELTGDGLAEDLRGKHGYLAGFSDPAEDGGSGDFRYAVFVYDLGQVMSLKESDFQLLGFVDELGKHTRRPSARRPAQTAKSVTLQ